MRLRFPAFGKSSVVRMVVPVVVGVGGEERSSRGHIIQNETVDEL